jgi:hypothetical protein
MRRVDKQKTTDVSEVLTAYIIISKIALIMEAVNIFESIHTRLQVETSQTTVISKVASVKLKRLLSL